MTLQPDEPSVGAHSLFCRAKDYWWPLSLGNAAKCNCGRGKNQAALVRAMTGVERERDDWRNKAECGVEVMDQQRGSIANLTEENARLREAVCSSTEALVDLDRMLHPNLCHPDALDETRQRVKAKSGGSFYVARVTMANNAALGEGEL